MYDSQVGCRPGYLTICAGQGCVKMYFGFNHCAQIHTALHNIIKDYMNDRKYTAILQTLWIYPDHLIYQLHMSKYTNHQHLIVCSYFNNIIIATVITNKFIEI
jgi:hypothetical protein